MAWSRVEINYRGIHDYLWTSKELGSALLAHAETGAAFARSIAPTGPPRDKHKGEFKASIRARQGRGPQGGIAAIIEASPSWVEFGRKHREPYHGAHVLGRTAQFLNAPKRRA
jgi:hypothetical protein